MAFGRNKLEMTIPILAGDVNSDLLSFIIFGGVFVIVGLIYSFYFKYRKLNKRQWITATCLYMSVVIYFFSQLPYQFPICSNFFHVIQPYASIALLIIAGVFIKKNYE